MNSILRTCIPLALRMVAQHTEILAVELDLTLDISKQPTLYIVRHVKKKKKALSLGSRKKRETCIRTPLFPPQNPSNYQLKTLNLTCKETFFLFYFIWQFLLSYVLEIFFLNLLLLLCLELIFFRVFVCFLN